jgi:hypothetical protein
MKHLATYGDAVAQLGSERCFWVASGRRILRTLRLS